MSNSQKRAIQNYRSRLSARGISRFEVLGLGEDRELIRALARRLAEDGPEASRLRQAMRQTIAGEPPNKGGILAALCVACRPLTPRRRARARSPSGAPLSRPSR